MRRNIALLAAATMIASAWTAGAALTPVSYGNNYSGPGGVLSALGAYTQYGEVRYKSLNNGAGTSSGEIYIGTGSLGTPANRSEISFNWNSGTTTTLFEYDPNTGVERATAYLTGGGTASTSWGTGGLANPDRGAPIYPQTGKPVDYILLKLLEKNPNTPYTFEITSLTGQNLGVLSSVNGSEQFWLITDPTLLAGGFKLTGDLTLTGTGNGDETDKLSISFGYTPSAVPEPATYLAGALLLLPFGASALRRIRKARGA